MKESFLKVLQKIYHPKKGYCRTCGAPHNARVVRKFRCCTCNKEIIIKTTDEVEPFISLKDKGDKVTLISQDPLGSRVRFFCSLGCYNEFNKMPDWGN